MSETISKVQSFSISNIYVYAVAFKDMYQESCINSVTVTFRFQVETKKKDDNKMAHNQTAEGNGLIFSCTVLSLISPSFMVYFTYSLSVFVDHVRLLMMFTKSLQEANNVRHAQWRLLFVISKGQSSIKSKSENSYIST